MKHPLKHSPKTRQDQKDPLHGLARILSKAGLCSRSIAIDWIRAGRVSVNNQVIRNPEARFSLRHVEIKVDDKILQRGERLVLMLHKPRGYITTRADEKNRATVYDLLPADIWLAPVGRLDQASSGLLLFSNDPEWAQQLLDPEQHVSKTYHVQIRPPLSTLALEQLATHSVLDGEVCLPMQVRELRCGGKTQWLEFILQEGRNRQIRRILQQADVTVLRLLRVAIGELALGELPSGQWRWLSPREEKQLRSSVY